MRVTVNVAWLLNVRNCAVPHVTLLECENRRIAETTQSV